MAYHCVTITIIAIIAFLYSKSMDWKGKKVSKVAYGIDWIMVCSIQYSVLNTQTHRETQLLIEMNCLIKEQCNSWMKLVRCELLSVFVSFVGRIFCEKKNYVRTVVFIAQIKRFLSLFRERSGPQQHDLSNLS